MAQGLLRPSAPAPPSWIRGRSGERQHYRDPAASSTSATSTVSPLSHDSNSTTTTKIASALDNNGELLEDQLRSYMCVGRGNGTSRTYRPNEVLDRIVTKHSIIEAIRYSMSNVTIVDKKLVDYVLTKAKRLFAISVYIGLNLQGAMSFFEEHDFDDDDLPLLGLSRTWFFDSYEVDEIDAQGTIAKSTKCLESLRRDRRLWIPSNIRRFFRAQWDFLGPVFPCGSFSKHMVHLSPTEGQVREVSRSENACYYTCGLQFQDACNDLVAAIILESLRGVESRREGTRPKAISQWSSMTETLTILDERKQDHSVQFAAAFRLDKGDYAEFFVLCEMTSERERFHNISSLSESSDVESLKKLNAERISNKSSKKQCKAQVLALPRFAEVETSAERTGNDAVAISALNRLFYQPYRWPQGLRKWFRPNVKKGYSRIEWHCVSPSLLPPFSSLFCLLVQRPFLGSYNTGLWDRALR